MKYTILLGIFYFCLSVSVSAQNQPVKSDGWRQQMRLDER